MARAINAGELTKLRVDGQKSNLILLFPKPSSVYTARVNQATFEDSLYQVTYDGGSGTLANVKAGMTMYIGSAAGLYDKGIARIRKTPTASIFYIGEASDIQFADDDYLTIVNEFKLWPKHPVVADQYVLMDYDDAYTDEHDDPNPTPVMGPHAAVKLVNATVAHQRDGSDSWSLGTSVSGHAWTAGGPATVTIDSMGSSTPTFTFSTAGYHLIQDTVTSANGKTKTGYRVTQVYDSTNRVDDFQLKECYGDFEEGGWSFTVRMFDDADRTNVVDQAMVMLVAEEEYADTAGSIGALAGYENLVCVGHIDGESIVRDPNDSSEVEFTVRGPHHWLQEIPGFPVGVENTGSTATAWTNFEDLTVDAGLWHLLEWRSTATAVMDIPSLTGDTKNLPTAEAPGSQSLWDQLNKIAWETILARPMCDRYGRMYIEPETQIVPSGDRSGFPTVMTITDNDWGGQINIDRQPKRKTSLIDMSGVYYDGSTATPLISKAMGVVYALYGHTLTVDSLLLASQAQLNTLSGNYFAWENNEYPHVDLNLAQNNRFFDIAPRQYAVLNLAAGDTPREITWSSKKFIPRRVELDYAPGIMQTYLELEAETIGTAAGQTVQYIPPPQYGFIPEDFRLPNINLPPLGPGINDLFPENLPTDPQLPPVEGATCPTDAEANGPFDLYMGGTMYSNDNYYRFGHINAVIRTAAHDNKTTYTFLAKFQKRVAGVWEDTAEDDFYEVYAYQNDGTIVATGVHDAVTGNGYYRTGTLNAVATTDIAYIGIVMEADLMRPDDVTMTTPGANYNVQAPDIESWSANGAGIKIVTTSGIAQLAEFCNPGRMVVNLVPPGGDAYNDKNYSVLIRGRQIATYVAGVNRGIYPSCNNDDVFNWYNSNIVRGYDNTHWALFGDSTLTCGISPATIDIEEVDLFADAQCNGSQINITFDPRLRCKFSTYRLEVYGTLFIWAEANYRIIIQQANLYNVCPAEA